MNTLSIRDRILQSCLELLRIPSVTGEEAAIADHMQRWALSLPHLRSQVIRRGNSVIVGMPDDTRPCVALVGHLDTVPPSGAQHVAPKVDGDRVIGLGSTDMKGSIAVIQTLFERLDLPNLPFCLMAIFYDREEGPYDDNGLQPLLDNEERLQNIDLAIAMEPTDHTLQLGCVGGLHAKVTFRGKAAHSARPWEGENAVHKAHAFLAELSRMAVREVEVEGLTFREVANVTLAHAGRARNVIPDAFEMNLNYRFAPRGTALEATRAAHLEVARLTQGADVEIIDVSPPGPVVVHNPIFEHLRNLTQLPVKPKQAWTDVARLAAHGIDAINFGPGFGAQAHQVGEWISHDAMVQAYDVLARTFTVALAV